MTHRSIESVAHAFSKEDNALLWQADEARYHLRKAETPDRFSRRNGHSAAVGYLCAMSAVA